MRFKGLDLNLLVALSILLELRNVSQAADRLGLSQPALSAALARLRDYFGDELLVLHGKRMHPTPFAERLLPHIRTCLLGAEAAIATSARFVPAKASRSFRIICSDYVVVAVLSRVAQLLASMAPDVRLDFILPDDSALEALSRGDVDLMVTPSEFLLKNHPHELLYEETHVIVGCRENPVFGSGLSADAVMKAGHVAVFMGSRQVKGFADRYLDQIAPDRRIEIVASSFAMVPWLLVGTQRLALMHKRLAVTMSRHYPISFAPVPFNFPIMQEMVQYHQTRSADEGLHWLVGLLRQIGTETTCA